MRVGIVGAEGSGKSTLARELAAVFDAPIAEDRLLALAKKYGGIPPAWELDHTISTSGVGVFEAAPEAATGVVFSEFTRLLTEEWAERLRIPLQRPRAFPSVNASEVDLWLLCHNDFPYTGPKERDEPVGRIAFFESLRARLRGLPNMVEVRGDGQVRVEMAAAAVREARTRHMRAKAELLRTA